ncbi:Dda-like helicase [Paraconexibacter sp. AEG42_29]|uniref:Dda-like helicase n=1 Tax=Paraconexibacter sp. AEG42_29 TaxID=2997339 RepID=A0AAU7APS1_9ACTN
MMTVRSIQADGAGDYADYLDGKTVAPERGDYYLGRDGEPAEAPGRWLASPESLRAVGVEPGVPVTREDLVALMQGRRPGTETFLRPAGPTGLRNAGVDVVMSAPKSVSVVWALAGEAQREELWRIHEQAVRRAVTHIRDTVPLTTRREGQRDVPAVADDLLAAEFRHSTSRGLTGRVPDPQLHSHVVVTSVVKADGRVAAVRDRAMYRAAREGGAFYRAALAEGLERAGYAVTAGTGKHGRYFEVSGVSAPVIDAFSGRAREIERIVRQFEAREGRRPSENELQLIKLDSRNDKLPHTRGDLRDAWATTAREHHQAAISPNPRRASFADHDPRWGDRVEDTLTRQRATFGARELRATALEQAAGAMTPETALGQLTALEDAGRLLALEGGKFTTRRLRAMEVAITRHAAQMREPGRGSRPAPPRALRAAVDQVAERLGTPLSVEQQDAVRLLAGPERLVALEGQAGTGKGVVIDAVARAERIAGRHVIGVATAGATAQRLGEDSPALASRTLTIASLLARHGQTGDQLGPDTTVFVDEAGMIDTPTLHALLKVAAGSGAKLVAIGDGKQLPAIGPGGMFDQLTARAPKATLSEVRRTRDAEELRAWRALRNGRPEAAMAHYLARDQLHLARDRDDALRSAVERYDQLAGEHGRTEVALMSDGSTHEIERMNARVQQLRLARGELGGDAIPLPAAEPDGEEPFYPLRAGDLVAWRRIQRVPGDARIENGTRGIVTKADPRHGRVAVALIGSKREVTVDGDDLAGLRLGYAQHVVRQQGATVDRAVAVAVTGGWQTSRESAYVQASRARHGIDWHIARDELGESGSDVERIQRLAGRMTRSDAKHASISEPLARPSLDPMLHPAPLATPTWTLPLDLPIER